MGVNHWHSEGYIRALQKCDACIVAVSDDDHPEVAQRWGATLGCKAYPSSSALLSDARPDLIYALARHCAMTALTSTLVDAGVPFVMEKPMGLRWQELVPVVERAQAKGLWAGVDFVARTLGLVARLLELRRSGELGTVTAYTYRLLAGTPERYETMNVGWMLDPKQSGGGALYNFGSHVFDLFLSLSGEPIAHADAWLSYRLFGLEIEDYALVAARTPSGAIGNMVVGYICPGTAYDRYFALCTDRLWVSSPLLGSGTIHWRSGCTEVIAPTADGEDFFLTYTRETLRRFRAGEPPVAPIADMIPVLRAINEAHAGAVVLR